ncbi:histidine kinase response regulator hybrid protein [Oceanospirillum sp. MED92]|uniref:histidine kinase n=2 Tax=Neptuniibacter caesariensis TaxID=207954 RepID=A0A7U8C4H7_NEPCE|nr:histidine kinase response regulator hybrid protein [Oceanospirillum sp. MED92] [Neptuniibacter caesariensis]
MISAQLPGNEEQRLEELYSYDILDSADEKEFDDLTQLASEICDTPIALISLIDPERQWFKSRVGLDATETSRDIAFCSHAILQEDVFEVEDTLKDARFADNPLVTGSPNIRFYAGAPLITPSGLALGTICTISNEPKTLTDWQRNALVVLRNEVISRLELRKKIKQLESANQYKSIFVSNVSHEIRTPMNGVMGLIDLLLETPLNDKQLRYAQAIKRSGDSLLRVINDVLDLSKVEAGKLTIEKAEFNLGEVVDDLTECFSPLATEKKLELRTDIQLKSDRFIGDHYRLKQILNNLLSNAIKFTDKGWTALRIKVVSETDDQATLKFSVSDTGLGLSEKQQSQLFKRFQQANETITREFGGSGLGLSICKQLLALMDGDIGVKSEPGKGSTFWFTLPLQVVREEPAVEELTETPDNFAGKVLVVEDNRVNQIVAKGVLEKLGLEVELAENGAVGMTKLRDNYYDLVFMDCHMPVMSGFEATKGIRSPNSLVHNPGIPIIAMSANAMDTDIEQCYEVGMDGFTAKPLEREKIKEVLSKYLSPVQAKESPSASEDIFTSLDSYPVLNKRTVKGLKLSTNHLKVMFRTFLDTTPQEINRLSQALIENDVETVRSIAHSIKGSARMLGGEQLGALAQFIESNADLGNELPVRKIIGQLDSCFDAFEDSLNIPDA